MMKIIVHFTLPRRSWFETMYTAVDTNGEVYNRVLFHKEKFADTSTAEQAALDDINALKAKIAAEGPVYIKKTVELSQFAADLYEQEKKIARELLTQVKIQQSPTPTTVSNVLTAKGYDYNLSLAVYTYLAEYAFNKGYLPENSWAAFVTKVRAASVPALEQFLIDVENEVEG